MSTGTEIQFAEPARSAPVRSSNGMRDMTTGSVRMHIVRMSLFLLAGMVVQTLYSLADVYWVSRLGQQAVAAVSLAANWNFVSLACTQILSVGTVALVSQAAGRRQSDEVRRLFGQGLCLAVVASACFLAACLALRDPYAKQLASDAHTAALAREFLLLFIPALALQFAMMGLGAGLRGIGDMAPGLVAQVGTVALNLVLAPIFIFGWLGTRPLGVTGAALATLLSSACGVVGLALYLSRARSPLCPRLADCRPHLPTWSKMLGIGLPAGGELLLVSITTGVIFFVTRRFGAPSQAGFGIAVRIAQAGFMPTVALGFAVASVVGQNFGSLAYERVWAARRESTKLALVYMGVFTAVCQVVPASVVSAFTPVPEVVDAGVEYLRTASWGFFANGVVFACGGVFQGLGNTRPALTASVLRAASFVAPVLLLSHRPGFEPRTIWLASLASVLLQFAVQQALLERELRSKAA